MYRYLLKPFLFLLSPETAHHFIFSTVKFIFKIPKVAATCSSYYTVKDERLKRTLFGLTFPNPVGLAAGFDKDAKLFDELSAFGFGFIEVGTVTPKPQTGNIQPRMFRLTEDEALINRMGFNNEGVEAMVERLKKRKKNPSHLSASSGGRLLIGGNLGKNKITPNENALADYEYCFEKLFEYVDYFVINVSSPNTPNLRELQEKKPLTKLLFHLQELNRKLSDEREPMTDTTKKSGRKPILLKIAPDLTDEQLDDIVEIVCITKIDGIVATNTTTSRENLRTTNSRLQTIGAGGLSGKPLSKRTTEVIKYLSKKSNKSFPIIASGGIHTAEDAIEKINAGASLIQVYTGFVYEGPAIAKRICKKLLDGRLC